METVQPIRDLADIEAVKNFLRQRSERNYLLFMFGINTGLRVGDILKLRIKDVRGKTHIQLREMKTGKLKNYLINKKLKQALTGYISDKDPNEFIFRSRKGSNKSISRQQAYSILSKAGRACGLNNIGTHSMRKTYAYHLYKKTGDVVAIMKILNHASPDITLRYMGFEQDQQDEISAGFFL